MLARSPQVIRMPRIRPTWAIIAVSLLISFPASALSQHADPHLIPAMHEDPKLTLPVPEVFFFDNMRPIWYAALSDEDPELRRLAADTIALAHSKGMQNLEDSDGRLLALFQREDCDRLTRRAAASALVALNAERAADAFLAQVETADIDLTQIIEPALARWNSEPMRKRWLERVQDPSTANMRLKLALECLAIIGETEALDALLERALDPNEAATIRLAAGRAAAAIDHSELADRAKTLADGTRIIDRLVAATLVTQHQDAAAVDLLRKLAGDDAAPVAGLALRTLLTIDPAHVYEFADSAAQHDDVNIRQTGAAALEHRADQESVKLLARLLNDVNRNLRRRVAEQLVGLAAMDELKDVVIEETVKVVQGDDWRGHEQALYVLGMLDHEPAAMRMVGLLRHRRPEVGIAAAVALRRVSVSEALPGMLAYATEFAGPLLEGEGPHGGIDWQLSELCQSFGLQRYAAAEPLMRKFIPKTDAAVQTRSGAIWALGWIHKDKAPPDLTAQLVERLRDVYSPMPEFGPIRRSCAVSLGRMRSESALKDLKEFSDFDSEYATLACIWAVHYMTGEVIAPPGGGSYGMSNWFLVPLEFKNPTKQAKE